MIRIDVVHDDATNVYVATSADIKGLVVEAETLEMLKSEVKVLVPQLLALEHSLVGKATAADLTFIQQRSVA